MKTEFEFTIPRTNGEDPCLATVSLACDPNGNPSFDILVIDRAGNYVETRPDEDAEIIDKAIERWGDTYARIFGDRHCSAAIRARVDFICDLFDDGRNSGELFRFMIAQRFENWQAADRLSRGSPAAPAPHSGPAVSPPPPRGSSGAAGGRSPAAHPASPPQAPAPPAPPDSDAGRPA